MFCFPPLPSTPTLPNCGTDNGFLPYQEPPVENETGKAVQRFNQAGNTLHQLIPVWRALALAQRVLGDEMPQPKVNTYRQLTRLRERIEASVAVMERIVADAGRSNPPYVLEAWYQVKSDK